MDRGIGLLIPCDTGISEHTALEMAQSESVDVIVTDHHDLPDRLPPAAAAVNPKRLAKSHPAHHLPGVAVAFQVVHALMSRAGIEQQLEPLLDLVAMGIVADLARVRDDVRYLLQRGLQVLRRDPRPGLRALMEMAEIEPGGVNEEHIGFMLAPRLNALGRLGDANPAVPFLLSRDIDRARSFAGELEALNERRKLLTEQVLLAAEYSLQQNPDYLGHPVLVLEGAGWPAGIVGLVASRLVERYARPVVLLSVDESGEARGSARSVEGIDISSAIAAQKDQLDSFGGHPMAAGLRMRVENIPTFRRSLSKHVSAVQPDRPTEPPLIVDAELRLTDINFDLAEFVERIGPYGPGNPQPVFAARNLTVRSQRRIGRSDEHRLLEVVDDQGGSCTAVWWNGGDALQPQGRFDLAFNLRKHTYRGETELQAVWIEAREHASKPVAVRAPARKLDVVDLRSEDRIHHCVSQLLDSGAWVWAEGVQLEWRTCSRIQLEACDELVLWNVPPGVVELQEGLRKADPKVIYFVGYDGNLDSLRPFLVRLSGMLKYAMSNKQGSLVIEELAAALGHKQSTVWEGISWLESRGHITIRVRDGDRIEIMHGGRASDAAQGIHYRLKASLSETAAFRRYLSEVDEISLQRYLVKLTAP
jgi:single-stranded-DNA-specific exonuclease